MLIVGVVIAATILFSQCVSSPAPPLEEVEVRDQQDATLQCRSPTDAEITLIEWNRPELKSKRYVFFYRNQRAYVNYQHESFRGRVELRDPSMKDGDVSVILRNVSLSDTGTYECHVRSRNIRSFRHSIILKVTASGFVEKVTKDRGDNTGFISLVTGVPAAVLFLVVVFGVFMYRKLKRKCANFLKSKLTPPPTSSYNDCGSCHPTEEKTYLN